MKKLLYIILTWFASFYGLTFAWNEFTYENAKNLARDYITNSSFDENWKDQNPTIFWEWKYFYTDAETPSYVEFKVSCDKNPDCWFVMVNFDWDDVVIPIASTSGNTPSEVLSAKNGSKVEENKFYYFDPFKQYAESKINENVSSIDPQDDFTKNSWSEKNSLQEKQNHNKSLKENILKAKIEAKEYKKSGEFKKIKKELKDKKQTNGKEEVSFKYLDMAVADEGSSWWTWYTPPSSSTIYITWNSTSNCWSRTPCYNQYKSTYNWKDAYSWCAPTAVAIIYWYYDRTFSSNTTNYNDLVPGLATDISNLTSPDINIKNMIDSLKTYMWSYYVYKADKWYYSTATNISNIPQAINYAKNKWYTNSTAVSSNWNTTTLFSLIKTEINSWRPVIANSTTHSMVAYWYNSTSWLPIIRVNMWWGPSNYLTWTNWVQYKYSNIDYNMNSIYYGTPLEQKPSISNITTFNIKK